MGAGSSRGRESGVRGQGSGVRGQVRATRGLYGCCKSATVWRQFSRLIDIHRSLWSRLWRCKPLPLVTARFRTAAAR